MSCRYGVILMKCFNEAHGDIPDIVRKREIHGSMDADVLITIAQGLKHVGGDHCKRQDMSLELHGVSLHDHLICELKRLGLEFHQEGDKVVSSYPDEGIEIDEPDDVAVSASEAISTGHQGASRSFFQSLLSIRLG